MHTQNSIRSHKKTPKETIKGRGLRSTKCQVLRVFRYLNCLLVTVPFLKTIFKSLVLLTTLKLFKINIKIFIYIFRTNLRLGVVHMDSPLQ